jgi:hypothetical protein
MKINILTESKIKKLVRNELNRSLKSVFYDLNKLRARVILMEETIKANEKI